MKPCDIFEAMGRLDDEAIMEAVSAMYKENKRAIPRKAARTILVAAVIVSIFAALGLAAYAGGFLGLRAMEDQKHRDIEGNEFSSVSITQPQELPEELDAEKAELIEKSKEAWQEWTEYKGGEGLTEPPEWEEQIPPGADGANIENNGDGTCTVSFVKQIKDPEAENGYRYETIKQLIISEEEHKQSEEYWENIAVGYGSYDFMYGVKNAEQEQKLEALAAEYGLSLRKNERTVFSSESSQTQGEGYYTDSEICEMTGDIPGNSGSIFREEPRGFDKLYWFDDGSFGLSYMAVLPSSGVEVSCYARSSVYTSLAGGREVGFFERDGMKFSERRYTAPDGTELVILTDGISAYIYSYLDKSYFAEVISQPGKAINEGKRISDADLDYIAGLIIYSRIGAELP